MHSRIWFLWPILVLPVCVAASAQDEDTSESIFEPIDDVLRKYSDCSSYSDEGEVVVYYGVKDAMPVQQFLFTTNFRRGEAFSFESKPPVPYRIKLKAGILQGEVYGEFLPNREGSYLHKALLEVRLATNEASTLVPLFLLGQSVFFDKAKDSRKWTELPAVFESADEFLDYQCLVGPSVYCFRIERKRKVIVKITKTTNAALSKTVEITHSNIDIASSRSTESE